jgi:hypothetical protein
MIINSRRTSGFAAAKPGSKSYEDDGHRTTCCVTRRKRPVGQWRTERQVHGWSRPVERNLQDGHEARGRGLSAWRPA